MDSETEVEQGGLKSTAYKDGDVVEMKITPRWVSILAFWGDWALVLVLAVNFYMVCHLHNDAWSLQIKAGLIDPHGKLKQEYQDQMDDARYHVMDWNRP